MEVGKTHKDIRSEIIREAGEQFRDLGYEGTSMRGVADALGISVGNLTYHFQKKLDLLEAVRLEGHKGYRPTPPPLNLDDFDAFFRYVLNFQAENAYYFRHFAEVGRLLPRVREMQEEVLRDRDAMLRDGFANLKAGGVMQEDELEGQTERLVQVVGAVCTYAAAWETQKRLDALWSLIYPHLTEAGKARYRSMTGQ